LVLNVRHIIGSRPGYVALALATIALGLAVHLQAVAMGSVARDIVGDALWAAMILWWISALTPRAALGLRGAIALCICVVVELSQLIHTPGFDAVRETTIGHLILGSGFDPRDFAAYASGILGAALFEWMLGRRGVA
jgi:hypothetical protein